MLIPPSGTAPAARFMFRFRRNRLALVACVVLVVVIVAAAAAPVLAPYDPSRISLDDQVLAPSPVHPFGTDRLGRDVFSRVLWGARVSLAVSLVAVTLGSLVGVLLGAAAGYGNATMDGIISRSVDVMLSLPTFFLLIVIQSLFPPSTLNVALIIGGTSWMALARIVRAQFLSLKRREFVDAARAVGANPLRIVFRHLLPSATSQIIVYFTLGLADAVLVESALSFLGLGVPAYEASWGNMLSDGQISILSGSWWVAFFPGLMILLTALSMNFVGDGLQESLYS